MNPTTLLSGLGAAITADPATGSASSAGRDASSGSGDLFLALVAGLLQGGTQGTRAPPPLRLRPTPPDEAPRRPSASPAPVSPSSRRPNRCRRPPRRPTPPPTSRWRPGSTSPRCRSPSGCPRSSPRRQRASRASRASTVRRRPSRRPTLRRPRRPTRSRPAGGSGQASADAGRSGDPDPNAATTPAAPTAADTPTGQPAGAATSQRTEARADPTPAPAPVSSVPGAATVAPTTAAAAAPTSSADVHRVTGQVFPEVLRASANADTGTSRVTVKLNPESLGEVRIVLTQRRGGLEVSLAAAHRRATRAHRRGVRAAPPARVRRQGRLADPDPRPPDRPAPADGCPERTRGAHRCLDRPGRRGLVGRRTPWRRPGTGPGALPAPPRKHQRHGWHLQRDPRIATDHDDESGPSRPRPEHVRSGHVRQCNRGCHEQRAVPAPRDDLRE